MPPPPQSNAGETSCHMCRKCVYNDLMEEFSLRKDGVLVLNRSLSVNIELQGRAETNLYRIDIPSDNVKAAY